jgi:hypothetical protein
LKIFLLSGPFEEIDVFYFFEIFLFTSSAVLLKKNCFVVKNKKKSTKTKKHERMK